MGSGGSEQSGVGRSWSVGAIVALLMCIAFLVSALWAWASIRSTGVRDSIVIAAGPDKGTYILLAERFGRTLENEGVVSSAKVVGTVGSVENMRRIGAGEADFAFVQSDTRPHEDARLVATLHDEALHILVASRVVEEIHSIYDLSGRRVCLGERGSGTRNLSKRVLDYLGIQVKEVEGVTLDAAAVALARTADDPAAIDAAFVLTAVPSVIVRDVIDRGVARLQSLGAIGDDASEACALEMVFPYLKDATIARGAYGTNRGVRTIGIEALLVARRDMPEAFVREAAKALFERRSLLAYGATTEGDSSRELTIAWQIAERYDPAAAHMPYHAGAVDYYQRKQPPFIVVYAEVIGVAFSLLFGAISGAITLRQWMRRKRKNRIDAYYIEIEKRATAIESAGVEDLHRIRAELDVIRRRAFEDLVAEKLAANESFTIFQAFHRDALAAIDARLAAR